MKFVSTRALAPIADLSTALTAALASDGGLYMPQTLPQFVAQDFDGCDGLADIAAHLLAPFFAGDALSADLPSICAEAFAIPAPLRALATPDDFVLELFHGPTAAFKDFGARFLAACLRRLPRAPAEVLTILVATSGDTGAAVAAAFHQLSQFQVVILYPEGRVSPRQAQQLGAFGDNVVALRVAGSFDDCQRLVKQAFADSALRARQPLVSANSISLGRLLPQMAYFAQASLLHWRTRRSVMNFIVPTGNLGNALACILARACGLPIGRIVFATNANRALRDFFAGADYTPHASVATLANAMDVGNPSNFERLRWLYPDAAQLRATFTVHGVDDAAIRATIQTRHARHGEVFCPHTATAVHALQTLRAAGSSGHWAVVATAHPAKFDGIVEPLIGTHVPVPEALAALLLRPSSATPLGADYASLRAHLLAA